MTKHVTRRVALAGLAAAATTCAFAQTPGWPAGTITIVHGYPAGGPSDLIARILDERNLEATDCCMWGDRKHDVLAASRHAIPTIGALWGYGGAYELREAGATVLCASPSEVPAAFWALASERRALAP